MYPPKVSRLVFFVLLQKRRSRETDKDRIGEDRLHGLVKLAGLSSVTFIHKNYDITLGGKILGQSVFQILNVFLVIGFRAAAAALSEFMNQ